MNLNPESLRMGKTPKKHDRLRRTLQLGKYIDLDKVELPPERMELAPKVKDWKMFANGDSDSSFWPCGDCTCASRGHHEQLWSANAGQEFRFTDAEIVAAYSAISGYDPKTRANDNGAALLDVLNYQRSVGIGSGDRNRKILAFAEVDRTNIVEVKLAAHWFGGLEAGVMLPISAQRQTVWDLAGDPESDTDAGRATWGGHAINFGVNFGTGTVDFITWAQVRTMTWNFALSYVDEVYAVLSRSWLRPDNVCPTGLAFNDLMSDLVVVARMEA